MSTLGIEDSDIRESQQVSPNFASKFSIEEELLQERVQGVFKENICLEPLKPTPLQDRSIVDERDEFDEAFFKEVEDLAGEISPEEVASLPAEKDVNFVIRIRDLVNQILEQLSDIAEKDRHQIDDMKKKYKISSEETSSLYRKIGDSGLWIAGASLLFMLGQFGFSTDAVDDKEMMKFLANQVPQVGGMFTSRYQSKQEQARNILQLVLAEYNAKTSKTQSESNSKNEVLDLLRNILDLVKRASSAN